MSKNEFHGNHLGFLAAILDCQWVLYNPVLYIWQSFVLKLVLLSNITIDGRNVIILPYFILQTGSSYLRIIPLILYQFYNIWYPRIKSTLKQFCSLCSIQMSIFLNLFKKNDFWVFSCIFKRAVIHSKIVRFTIFFLLQIQVIPMKFLSEFFIWILSISKKSWVQNVKNLNFVEAILNFRRPSWIDHEYFITLYSI